MKCKAYEEEIQNLRKQLEQQSLINKILETPLPMTPKLSTSQASHENPAVSKELEFSKQNDTQYSIIDESYKKDSLHEQESLSTQS